MKNFSLFMAALLATCVSTSAADVTFSGNDFPAVAGNTTKATKDGFTIEAKKGNGPTPPALDVFDDVTIVRAYATNTITVSGKAINKVVFNLNTATGYKRYARLIADAGSVSEQHVATSADDMDVSITWTGEAASVVFTVSDTGEFGTECTSAGQLHILSFEVSGEGGVADEPRPEGTTYIMATAMAPGNYIIASPENGKAAATIAANKNYGYLPAVAATAESYEITTTGNTYTFEAAAGGYYIKDEFGRYLSQRGSFTSFNLSGEPSAEEGIFTVAISEDGYATIVNTHVNKTMAYSSRDTGFGCYPELNDDRTLPKLYAGKSDAVNRVDADSRQALVEFFSLQGMRINEPAAGQIVIRRQGDRVSKVLVK